MDSNLERKEAADYYSFAGLDNERGGYEQGRYELNMRRLAYAQVQATIYLGDQMGRLADAMGAVADSARDTATSLEGINQGSGAR